MKIGIFGGTFNPPHIGHINSAQSILKLAGLDKIKIIVANQNPLKIELEGPNSKQRMEMTKEAFSSWGNLFEIDDQEVKRGGKSYTIDTISSLKKSNPESEFFLIIGLDQFESFDGWKDVEEILKGVNLVVTSRPGFDFPQTEEELPKAIQKVVAAFDFNFVELTTGRHVQFVNLKDIDVSSSQLRKWIRIGKNVEKYIPLSVERFIKTNKIYEPLKQKIKDYKIFTEYCANVLFAKKGIQVKGYDLTKLTAPSEYTLIASGTSTRHASSLAENVAQSVKEEFNVLPQSIEGLDEGRWVILDYGSLIIHVFYDYVRTEYALENLWKNGLSLALQDPTELAVKAPN